MKYFEVKPHPALRGYIKCFWYLEKDLDSSQVSRETILPDGCVDFVFQANGKKLYLQTQSKPIRLPDSFLIGLQKIPILLFSNDRSITYGIRFFAYGAHPFLKMPLNELQESIQALDDLFGNTIPKISNLSQDLPTTRIFEEFERFLLQRLFSFKSDIQAVETATQALFQQRGFADIAKLALHLNLTTRTLERKFDEIVGLSPKALARVIRFDHIKNELILNSQVSLTELSFRYGYFDQAHFIHDFKLFTGKTPSLFKAEVMKQPMYFYK